jgi:hypothetical protein
MQWPPDQLEDLPWAHGQRLLPGARTDLNTPDISRETVCGVFRQFAETLVKLFAQAAPIGTLYWKSHAQ